MEYSAVNPKIRTLVNICGSGIVMPHTYAPILLFSMSWRPLPGGASIGWPFRALGYFVSDFQSISGEFRALRAMRIRLVR